MKKGKAIRKKTCKRVNIHYDFYTIFGEEGSFYKMQMDNLDKEFFQGLATVVEASKAQQIRFIEIDSL